VKKKKNNPPVLPPDGSNQEEFERLFQAYVQGITKRLKKVALAERGPVSGPTA